MSAAHTRLFLVRHGEVETRYQRVFGGRIDMALSPRGQEQARALAGFLERTPFDFIYASPMQRVQETMIPLVNAHRPVPQVRPGLREVDFGAWTGLTWEQVRDRHGVSAFDWLTELHRGGIPQAEPVEAFGARTRSCLDEILEAAHGRTAAVVCHGGVIRMLLSHLLELPLPRMAAFEIDYASVTILDWRPGRLEIQLLNYTPWRPLP